MPPRKKSNGREVDKKKQSGVNISEIASPKAADIGADNVRSKNVSFAPSTEPVTSTVNRTVVGNRREMQRRIAEKRAAHFARAESSSSSNSLRTSTPTGSLRLRQSQLQLNAKLANHCQYMIYLR
jgi:hypothetical protein